MSNMEQALMFFVLTVSGLLFAIVLRVLHMIESGTNELLAGIGDKDCYETHSTLPNFSDDCRALLVFVSGLGSAGFLASLFQSSFYLSVGVALVFALLQLGLSSVICFTLGKSGLEFDEEKTRTYTLFISVFVLVIFLCQCFDRPWTTSFVLAMLIGLANTYIDQRVSKTWNW